MNPCARRLSRTEVSVHWLAKCAKCIRVCNVLLFTPYYSEPNQASPCTECISGYKFDVMKIYQNCLSGGFEALFLIIIHSLLPPRAENTWKYIILTIFSVVHSFTPFTVDRKQLYHHLQNPCMFNPPTCRTGRILIDDIMLPSNGNDGFKLTATMFRWMRWIYILLICRAIYLSLSRLWVTSFRERRCCTFFDIDNKSLEIKLKKKQK